MRLLICDSFRISTFVLPTKVEDYFTINYYYSSGSFSTIETLNLEAKNGVWNLLTNESLIIKLGDVFLKEVVLKEYSIYKINFSDIKENIYIYVLGDSVNYYNYSTLESQKIVIGNSANATICCADKVSLEEQLVIYRDGNSNFNVVNNDNPNLYVYLNGYTFKEKKLEIGDVIFLNGLKIIWMGNFIKVNQIGTQARFVKLTTFNDSVNNEYTKVSDADYGRNATGAKKLEAELLSDINKAHKALSKSDKAYTDLVNTIKTYWHGSDANKFLKLLEDQRASIQGKIRQYEAIVTNALSTDRQGFEKTQATNASMLQSNIKKI